MKDGTKLYTYGVLPPEGVKCGIVLRRTPYVPEKPADVAAFVRGQQKALARGYAYVVQHVRGTGMSEGDWIPYVNERADGLATLEWLRRLPCYNGEIYVSGGSYLSSVHWSYLGTNPPDVKGAVLNIASIWGQTGGACEAAYSAAKAGLIGSCLKIDLGIVKCHFELGAGKENFSWAD